MASTLRFDNWEDSNGTPILDGTNLSLPSSAMPAGNILQVVSVTKTDIYSASLTTGQQSSITGLFESITPKSTSSKILITVNFMGGISLLGGSTDTALGMVLKRNGVEIGTGDASGNRQLITGASSTMASYNGNCVVGSFTFLDSPATASSVQYSIDICHNSGVTQTVYLNRADLDLDTVTRYRGASSITLMEVAG